MQQKITFDSDGLLLSGDLYTPPGFDANHSWPAILLGGSWTTVKEQMSGRYAGELAGKGFVTLAIDPRYFGESEGRPRFWENPAAKIADFRNAVSYLQAVPGVDPRRIFLTAICASAGYMASLVATDNRISGWATVAAWLHDAAAVKMVYGGEEAVRTKMAQTRRAKQVFADTGQVEYIPAISRTDGHAAMVGDFDYYLDPHRGAIPEWSADRFAVMSWEDWLSFDPMPLASTIHVPTLMIHSDGAVLGENAKRFFSAIPQQNKVLHWTVGTQFDFYDQPLQVAEAVDVICFFFKNHI